jgi:hypothetical protein
MQAHGIALRRWPTRHRHELAIGTPRIVAASLPASAARLSREWAEVPF